MPTGEAELALTQVTIKVAGAAISAARYALLDEIEVDDSLFLPSMATLRFHDPEGDLIDGADFDIGKPLVVMLGTTPAQVFDGEITSIEPDFNLTTFNGVTIRAYDRGHRLLRGNVTRTFLNVSDSDIVSSMAGDIGLTAEATSTSVVHDYVAQNNETNYDFLRRRAARLGMLIRVVGTKLTLKEIGGTENGPALVLGVSLKEFHPRRSAVEQVSQVSVRNWDPVTKASIVGVGSSAEEPNQIGVSSSSLASAFSITAKAAAFDVGVTQASEAQKYGEALFAQSRYGAIQAEGKAFGDPAIAAGKNVAISNLGSRYSGTYFITRAIHRYTTELGYETHIESTNGSGETAASLLGADTHAKVAQQQGLVIGVVTDNKDAEGKMGRVKVKFPGLMQDNNSSDVESTWARITSPFAGASRGMQFLPDVNDEVLVGFELGDLSRPYIVGSLWNGVDKPPLSNDEGVDGTGKVKRRVIKTNSGHLLAFDDSSDAPKIELIDKTGKNKFVIDSSANTVTIECAGDVTVKATGKVNIEATSDLAAKGMQVSVKSDGNLTVESAAQLTLKASAGIKMDGGAMVEIKGGMVKIN